MPLKISASQGSGPHGASPLSSWEIRTGVGNGSASPARKRERQVEGRHPELFLRSLCPPHCGLVGEGRSGLPRGPMSHQGFWGRGPNCAPRYAQGDSDSPQGESASSPWLRRNEIPSGRMYVLISWEAPPHRRGPTSHNTGRTEEQRSPRGTRENPLPQGPEPRSSLGSNEVQFQSQREPGISPPSISKGWWVQNSPLEPSNLRTTRIPKTSEKRWNYHRGPLRETLPREATFA